MSEPATMPTVGARAPWPAGITNQAGRPIDLAAHRGRHVLLYFYPKDDTPGCTVEACNFRDHHAEIDAVIYGASLDDGASHQAFAGKFSLPFDLLVDPERKLAKAFGVLPEGGQYVTRSSFLIGPDGTIKAVWPKVKPDQHWSEVKAAISSR
jgi:thioredoxin-dependent peroxiredoxin